MKLSYTADQYDKAIADVIGVYKMAEERMKMSPIPYSLVQLRNAFQVFRYAFREWAKDEDRGVVLRALMVADERAKEVKSGITEMTIQCEDRDVAEALARLLESDGYETTSY